jgi:hypothetical protein
MGGGRELSNATLSVEKKRSTSSDITRLRSLPAHELERRLSDLPVCSANQMRLWYDHLLEPNSNSYNVPLTFRISGQVDVEALQRALSELLERHLILRIHQTLLDRAA